MSTTAISDDIVREYNITVHNTPLVNSHIYGAMMLLSNIEDNNTSYCLLHDSMALLKPLPESILEKRFYYHWHFDRCMDWERGIVTGHICTTTLSDKSKQGLIALYNNCSQWHGLFGPAFGGNIRTLKEIIHIIGLSQDNLYKFCGRTELMVAERLLAIIPTYMGVVDPFPGSYSLNGCIFNHPQAWHDITSMLSLQDIKIINYDSFMFKSWLVRD